MRPSVFAAPRGSPHHYPVRRPVTCPAKAFRIDEGFQKIDRVPIDALPVLRDLAAHPAEDVRAQVWDSAPRQNKKACVVGEEADVAPPGFAAPADEVVAAPPVSRRRNPPQPTQPPPP